MVLNPGARQDWAMKPSLSSARQITSSPCFQSHEGMFSRYACRWRVRSGDPLSVPAAHLVVVLHQLDDDSALGAVVLHGDDPHDVGGVFGIRVRAVLVGQHQTGVSLVNLTRVTGM